MATTKERILVTLTPDMSRELKLRAKREKSPRATIAARLIREAIGDISDEEDRYLSAVGDRILATTKRWYSHEDVWGKKAGR